MKKEHSKYHQQYHKVHRKSRRRFFFFFTLLIFGAIVFFTSFYEGNLFTGKAIVSIDIDNAAKIRTFLSVPELNLNGEYEEVVLVLKRGSVLLLDGKKISLDGLSSELVLKNFKGHLFFDDNSINVLEGQVSEIILNGNPIASDNKMKISLESGSYYESIEVSGGFYLKNLDYITSGEVSIDKSVLKPNSERVILKNYLGSLKVIESKFILDGYVEYFELEGDSVKSVFSR